MVTTSVSSASASHHSPASLLRSRFGNTKFDTRGSPYNTEIGSETNKANIFQGPGFIKHIYILTQQDEFETSLTVPTLANWNEADVTLYDAASTRYADFGSPIYKQVIPMGIPDGFLQEIVDDIKQKYNAFILWIDSNLIGAFDGNATASQNCAGYGSVGTYTGTLVQECGNTSTNLANCRKLNKMICSFNWGLDKVVDFATGYFHPDDDGPIAPDATACAGAESKLTPKEQTPAGDDWELSEATYEGVALGTACGGSRCTKLNDLVCKLNWFMVKVDATLVGAAGGCDTSNTVSHWRSSDLDLVDACPTDGTCSKLNYLRCYIAYHIIRTGFDTGSGWWASLFNIDFTWFLISTSTVPDVLTNYTNWDVPLRDYISQNWAPQKDFIDLGESAAGLAPQFDFDNYNRNQGFQITFPEPGLYVTKGLTVMQNTDNGSDSGTRAPAHINVIFQQASTSIDAKTGGVLNA